MHPSIRPPAMLVPQSTVAFFLETLDGIGAFPIWSHVVSPLAALPIPMSVSEQRNLAYKK
jgi:hypothetical protein